MTPVGHSLTGVAIALVALPCPCSPRRRLATMGAFALLASLPDWPFPNWGHDRYEISHSLFVNLLLLSVLVPLALFLAKVRRWAGGTQVVVAGALAVLSHLLLDTFYNHGHGLGMFWPFSNARLALPFPYFETLKTSLPAITPHSLRVMGIELLAYGPLVLLAAWLAARRREPGELPAE